MLDCHFHLDRYDDPLRVAKQAAKFGVFGIAVTNLPSHFQEGLPHAKAFPRLRLALGMHPLSAEQHSVERDLFSKSLNLTSFVGEVGLDFSRHGIATRAQQLETFRFLAGKLSGVRKVVSLHSRKAESAVLDILTEFRLCPAIFHWYSGPLSVADEALAAGHYFSVNPAMVQSESGRRIIDRVPIERLLTETDGPYAKLEGMPLNPWDVAVVEDYLGSTRDFSSEQIRSSIWDNFRTLLRTLGLVESA